jgi:hypothetical protein
MNRSQSELADILSELIQAKEAGDFQKIVSILHFNKNSLSKREACVKGVITFGSINEMIKSYFISNKMNREEELDIKKSYVNKFSHLIRFVDGISRKSHLQLSFIPTKGEKLFISDDGTMMSLCFGQYRNSKKLNGHEISDLIDSISTEYECNGTEHFWMEIRKWIDNLTESQLDLKYSLDDIIRSTKTEEYFNQTTIQYEINLFNIKQHTKDQQNANLQPNPWVAHNFYKAPMKADDEYELTFCGDTLQSELFSNVIGIGYEPNTSADRLFRKYATGAKKTERDIPFYTTLGTLLCTSNFDDILNYNKYFVHFNKHEDSNYGSFWYARYNQLVKEIKLSDMKEHVEVFKLIQEGGWSRIVTSINQILKDNHLKANKALQELTPFKDDFSMYITYVIMALHKLYPTSFSRTPNTNIEKIKSHLINNIISVLEDDSVYTTFLYDDDSTNWDARFERVWKKSIKLVLDDMGTKSKAEKSFDREVNHQKESILQTARENNWGNTWTCYPHQGSELIDINFNRWEKTMAGLHCLPRDMGGTAEDGVIFGLVADNGGDWKYQNLNELFSRPSDYWESLGNRNSQMLKINRDKLSESKIRRIEDFIKFCDTIASEGLEYIIKK